MNFKLHKKFLSRQKLPVLFYSFMSFLLLIALISTFNTYIMHVKIEMAVVSSPLETVSAPLSGLISGVFVTQGNIVQKGTTLVKIENVALAKELQMALLTAEEARFNIAYYENLLANEQQRLKIYENVGANRLQSAEADVGIALQEFLTAKKNLTRMSALHKKHYLNDAEWELVQAKYRTANDKLKSATALKNLEYASLNSVDQGLYFTGNKLEGRTKDLLAELEVAKNRLKIEESRVKVFEGLMNKLTLLAPFDGKILKIIHSVGHNVESAKPILLLEPLQVNKTINAYLTQNEVLHLSLHSPVKIFIPALKATYYGILQEVNRTSGFIDEMNAQYRSRDVDYDRTAIAIVAVSAKDQERFNRETTSGMPAIIYFTRKLTAF